MRFGVSVAVLTLLMAGCASVDAGSGGQGPDMQALGQLVPGVTTTAQVKELIGQPLRATRFERMQRDVWEYRRYNDPMSEYQVTVQFSGDGIVREVLVLKDYNREPCGP